MRKSAALLLVLVIVTASCIVMFLPVQAESRTIVVPDDYPTITAAIAGATDGDTVFVKKGTYEGPMNQTLVINKTLSLIGEDAEDTRINLHPPLVPMQLFTYRYMGYSTSISIDANAVKLANLTIMSDGGGISMTGNATEITGNIIGMSITATGDRTKIMENKMVSVNLGGSNQTIAKNIIEGIVTCGGSYNSIVGNNIVSSNTDGVVALKGSSNIVYENIIDGNGWYGIKVTSNSSIIAKNNITDCVGIYMEWASNNTICANRINDSAGIELISGHNNVFSANFLENNTIGIRLGYDQTDISRTRGGPKTTNNRVYHNNFIRNAQQAVDWNWIGTNYWDNGKEGNYWSDYSGSDWNFNGVGDTPYTLSEAVSFYAPSTRSTDRYPLMAPFDIDSVTVELPEWATISPTLPTESQSEPFPTPLAVAVAILVAAVVLVATVSLVLSAYLKKRK
jgi:parallel beta-helix repeat protein